MKPIYRWCYMLIGTLFLILGMIGLFLPLVPSTPFLLLTSYFYTRGSKRINKWFRSSKLYQEYILSFKKGELTKKQKVQILIFCYIGIAISAYFIDNGYIRLMLLITAVVQAISMLLIKTKEDKVIIKD